MVDKTIYFEVHGKMTAEDEDEAFDRLREALKFTQFQIDSIDKDE